MTEENFQERMGRCRKKPARDDALEIRSTKIDDSRRINEWGKALACCRIERACTRIQSLCVVMRTMIEIAHARTAGVLQTGTIEGQGVSSQSET